MAVAPMNEEAQAATTIRTSQAPAAPRSPDRKALRKGTSSPRAAPCSSPASPWAAMSPLRCECPPR